MQELAASHSLYSWYLASDDLLSPSNLVDATASNPSSPVRLYTSHLVDSIPDKARQALAGGFNFTALQSERTDKDREEVLWRTLLDLAVAQCADVHLSSWSSNQARIAYSLATAMSEARMTSPFIEVAANERLSKRGIVERCS